MLELNIRRGIDIMKIAVFDTKSYDIESFKKYDSNNLIEIAKNVNINNVYN